MMSIRYLLLFCIFWTSFTGCVSSCNKTTEWQCPNKYCIPIAYKCDNVPDCPNNPTDETTNCTKPPVLADFAVKVDSLKANLFEWSTPGYRFTNVTIQITYTDGITGKNLAFNVYGKPELCKDYMGKTKTCSKFKAQGKCVFKSLREKYCRATCGLCRNQTFSIGTTASFSVVHLLDRNASNVRATAFASNYLGDGKRSVTLDVPLPKLPPVKDLAINITYRFSILKEAQAKLTWKNAKFVAQPGLDAEKLNKKISHNITHCRLNGKKHMDCENFRSDGNLDRHYFSDLKYYSVHEFSVVPVYKEGQEEILGPKRTVSLLVSRGGRYQMKAVNMFLGVFANLCFWKAFV